MQQETRVTFQGMPVSDEIQAACWKQVERLERYYDRITSCRVLVAEPHHHHRKGTHSAIKIELTVPGGVVVVDREPPDEHPDEKLEVALHHAFAMARRRLQDFVRRQRGDTKAHRALPQGKVTRLDVLGGFGFVEREDGRELYFHRNAVRGVELEDLEPGESVRFAEELGERGPQARWIRPTRRKRAKG
jgi:cold shock CspA family protein